MRKIILAYGIVSGLIVISTMILAIIWGKGTSSQFVGYLIMLVALSVIFVGIRQYRDKELGGVITFGTAALIGLGISVVASVIYVAVWEIYLASTDYAFINDYIASVIAGKEADGVTGAQLEAVKADMEALRAQYANPLFRLPITFMEIIPVGLVITLISATVLRKTDAPPAM